MKRTSRKAKRTSRNPRRGSKVEFVVDLSRAPHIEDVKFTDASGAKAILFRGLSPLVEFKPTDSQVKKILSGKGKLQITEGQIVARSRWPHVGKLESNGYGRSRYGSYSNDPRWMAAKYPGVDSEGKSFRKGDEILYWPSTKTVMTGATAKDAWRRFLSEKGDDEGSPFASNPRRAGSAPATLKDVEAFVRGITRMDVSNEGTLLSIDTRENGSVYDSSPGEADISEGRKVVKAIRDRFPEFNVELEVIDEWVSITVDGGPKKYRSMELAEALKKAFPKIQDISRVEGTDRMACGYVDGLGKVCLNNGPGPDYKSSLYMTKALHYGYKSFGPEKILIPDLKPATLRRVAKKLYSIL